MSRIRLDTDGDVDMSVPQPIFEYIAPPKMMEWDQAALVQWRRERWHYEERVRERCKWTNEPFENVVAGIRSTIDSNLLSFLFQYKFGKDKQDVSDEEIMEKVKERCETMNDTYISEPSVLFSKQLKMDLSFEDVPSRVSKYYMLFERIIEDNGFQENLGRGRPDDRDYADRMKERNKILVDNLMPQMLKDEIQEMLKQLKYKRMRSSDQLLYQLILDRAKLQQLFFNRFRGQEMTGRNGITGSKKIGKVFSNKGENRVTQVSRYSGAAISSAPKGANQADRDNCASKRGIGYIPRTSAPRYGCLHCKGDHWIRDCPIVTQEEREAALKAQREKRTCNVKRVAINTRDVKVSAHEEDGLRLQAKEGLMDEEYSAWTNGVLEVPMCPDTGADCSVISAHIVKRVQERCKEVVLKPFDKPLSIKVAGGHQLSCTEMVHVDLQIRTSAGPVNIYKVRCLVISDKEDQLLLGKDVMQTLGIDVKRAFELLANTSIELNRDDLPHELELGEESNHEVEREIGRMCNEVRDLLKEDNQSGFRDALIAVHQQFKSLWRTRIGPDGPALVEPLRVTFSGWRKAGPIHAAPVPASPDQVLRRARGSAA